MTSGIKFSQWLVGNTAFKNLEYDGEQSILLLLMKVAQEESKSGISTLETTSRFAFAFLPVDESRHLSTALLISLLIQHAISLHSLSLVKVR